MVIIRKLIVISLCLMLTSSICLAYSESGGELVNPSYIGVQDTSESFLINSDGVATMGTSLTPKQDESIDEVKVTLKIKNADGTIIYNKTYTATWSSLYDAYRLKKTYQLTKRGNYQFQATYKSYKNDSLVETIKSSYILDTY